MKLSPLISNSLDTRLSWVSKFDKADVDVFFYGFRKKKITAQEKHVPTDKWPLLVQSVPDG